jgi:hypothetical protein
MVYFSNYTRRVNEATFLAKRIMPQVEYHWAEKEFSQLKAEFAGEEFKDMDSGFEYTYALSIKDWKFPFLEFIGGGGVSEGDEGESDSAEDPAGGMIEQMLEKVLGKEILKIAHVEVFWPEGAKRNSVTLTLLLTNQRKVDEQLLTLAPSWEKFQKELNKKPNTKNNDNNGRGGRPPPDGNQEENE